MSDDQKLFFLGIAVYPQYDLGTNNERHIYKLRPSPATQLASAVWHSIQGSQMEWICGINKPAGGNIHMKDSPLLLAVGNHKQAPYVPQSLQLQPQSWCFHKCPFYTPVSHPLIIHHCLTPPPPLCPKYPHLALFSLHVSFPHSSLAWVPRQMVHASRCSPPSLSKEKQRLDPRQTKSVGDERASSGCN